MITTTNPDNWQALQNEVARVLEECGFNIETERVLETARGQKEIDVYAEEEVRGRIYRIICECKYWQRNVPQEVVHSFRTVTADIGANVGYIISMEGFQAGAYKAAEYTNIELLNWQEFLTNFESSWIENFLIYRITDALDPLLSHTEPILPRDFQNLSNEEQERYIELKNRYDSFGALVMLFTIHGFRIHSDIPELPIINRIDDVSELLETVPVNILNEQGYREFSDALIEFGQQVLLEFREALNRDAV